MALTLNILIVAAVRLHWYREHIYGWGLKLSERGGRNAKKRAVVAVARKLAVLLHKLWVSKEFYEPLRNNRQAMARVA